MELSELWAAWTSWCEESSETLGNQRRFADRLTERTFDEVHGTNNMAIRRGIALRHDGARTPPGLTIAASQGAKNRLQAARRTRKTLVDSKAVFRRFNKLFGACWRTGT